MLYRCKSKSKLNSIIYVIDPYPFVQNMNIDQHIEMWWINKGITKNMINSFKRKNKQNWLSSLNSFKREKKIDSHLY